MGPWGTEPCGCGTRAWRGGGSCGLSRKEQVTLALGVLNALAGDFEVIGVALDIDCVQPHRGRSDGCGAGATEGIDNGLRGIKLGDAPFHEADGFLGRVNLAAIDRKSTRLNSSH